MNDPARKSGAALVTSSVRGPSASSTVKWASASTGSAPASEEGSMAGACAFDVDENVAARSSNVALPSE